MIYHYYQLSNHVLKFQDNVCSSCHDLTMLNVNISNIAVITVKNVDFYCIILNISKSEAIHLVENSVLEKRGYIYKNIALNFSLSEADFFKLFLFSRYK